MSLPPEDRDLDRVRDMLAYAERAMQHVATLDEAAFRRSRLHQDAVVRAVMVIGEAAYRTTPAFRAGHPELPWQEVIRMRHKLVHDYGEISLTVVWETVRDDLPALLPVLRAILRRLG